MSAERRYTWDEYLALERETGIKHEYVDGYVYAMSGGTRAHSRLAAKVIRLVDAALDGKPCATYTSDLKVWMPTLNRARYPDVSVVCGNPEGDEHDRNVTTGPTVLFEVLSRSTTNTDQGEKFREYVRIPTLRHYVLLLTTAVHVQHWRLGADGRWTGLLLGPEDTLDLDAIDVRLPVHAIYEGVALDPYALRPPRED